MGRNTFTELDDLGVRIDILEEQMLKCPIQMASIQLYAEEFENANQFYNTLVQDIKEIKETLESIKQIINQMNGYDS